MTGIAISQSNYIPWKGYFDLIASVDIFVFYDDMQYTRRDWRNRNKIKTPNGLTWLTVPVEVKGKYLQKINEVQISDPLWGSKHWKVIEAIYKKSQCYAEIEALLKPIYESVVGLSLSEINMRFITSICDYLGIGTELKSSTEFELVGDKSERLLNICVEAGASSYRSGPAAKGYLDVELFSDRGVVVEWQDYSGYSEYNQLWGDFEHNVSIIDLLFNAGLESKRHMKYLKT